MVVCSINSITYTNDPLLVDWDTDVQEWNSVTMAQWPFGTPLLEQDLIERDVCDCLDKLDHNLEFEEWLINQDDDYDDDNDDDVYYETGDEGHMSDVETYDEDEWPINFGLAPFLMHILL